MSFLSPRPGCFAGLAICMLAAGTAHGVPKEGFPEPIVLEGSELVLNGTATRSVFGVGVYDAGLYVSEASSDGDGIMERDHGPKRLKIIMLRPVPEAKFASAVRDNLDKNLTAFEQTVFAVDLEAFFKSFENGTQLDRGSEIALDYLPSEGTIVMVDGKRQAVIPGRDFYHALLRLWIGKPLQSSMKTGLLGAEKP
ncbi:MAG: chalcone isomerase family protein [Terrimicrobiaceae bacterium]